MSGKLIGKFEEIEEWLNRRIESKKGMLECEDVAELITLYQDAEMDANIIIAGQNGTGKSWTALAIAKEYCKLKNVPFTVKDCLLMGYLPVEDIEQAIATHTEHVFVLDEAQYFLNYLDFMTKQAKTVIKAIEKLRARRNALLVCVRDARRLVNTFRNGKAMLVIHLTDRHITTNIPFGFVLSANNFFESEDKFFLNRLVDITSFYALYASVEELPTFRGYFFSKENPLTEGEIREYMRLKEKQMMGIRTLGSYEV